MLRVVLASFISGEALESSALAPGGEDSRFRSDGSLACCGSSVALVFGI
jgi:hypothetical protein